MSGQFWGRSSLGLVVVAGYTAVGLGAVSCTVVGFALVGCIGVGFALVMVGCTWVDYELVGCTVEGFGVEGHEVNVVSMAGGFVFEEEDFWLVGEGCTTVGWVATD